MRLFYRNRAFKDKQSKKKGANKTQRKKYKIFYDQLRKVPDIPIGVLQIRWQA